MEKMWSECSVEEKREVWSIEKSLKKLKSDYSSGLITRKQYGQGKRRLREKIDKIEAKYGLSDIQE